MKVENIKIGMPVIYWASISETGQRDNPVKTLVASDPWNLPSGESVCMVKNIIGCVAINHLDEITPGSLIAAKFKGLKDISTEEIKDCSVKYMRDLSGGKVEIHFN